MNQLQKLNNFKGVQGPVLTIVMDGVGLAPDTISNAVAGAYTPTLDALMANYPMVSLKAHGVAVGLPSDDDMGNSEVGHNALGAGQVFAQGAKLVSNSIESGKMFASATWQELIANVKANNSTLHFMGISRFKKSLMHTALNGGRSGRTTTQQQPTEEWQSQYSWQSHRMSVRRAQNEFLWYWKTNEKTKKLASAGQIFLLVI